MRVDEMFGPQVQGRFLSVARSNPIKFCKRCRKRLDYLNRETVHLVALKAPEADVLA